jgi:hypothetical protein
LSISKKLRCWVLGIISFDGATTMRTSDDLATV